MHGDDEGDIVDDLTHAATFALMTAAPYVATTDESSLNKCVTDAKAFVDADVEGNDDISLDLSTKHDSVDQEGQESDGANPDSSCSSDSDSKSDLDLAADLAQMDPDEHLDEEDDDTGHRNGVSLPPKTANEVDAYRTPIQELEQHLHFQLTVDPDGVNSAIAKQNLAASSVRLAGKIKHYMALDRTVVVESAVSYPHGNVSSFSTENAPLDEGTLLLLQPPPSIFTGKEDADKVLYIPLGRIFEVFGPVSNPLYTIRLFTKRIGRKSDASTQPGDSPTGANSTKEQGKEIKSAGFQSVPRINTPSELAPSETHADDPWAPDGKYAILLQQNNALPVYYVHDEAKLIDMGFVAKISRKGCGELFLSAASMFNEGLRYVSHYFHGWLQMLPISTMRRSLTPVKCTIVTTKKSVKPRIVRRVG